MISESYYRVRALGELWDGSQTWGEKCVPHPGDDAERKFLSADAGTQLAWMCQSFEDFARVSDFEIVKVDTETCQTTVGNPRLLKPAFCLDHAPGDLKADTLITRTITDTRETTIRPWDEIESDARFEFLSWEEEG